MDKGKNKAQEPEYAYVGACWVVPDKSKPEKNSYELSSRYNNVDKSTGNYSRYTVKEKTTANERHVERGSRREGVRDEYKASETVKVGNKRGYTEYHTEQRVRVVRFNQHHNYQGGGGGKKYLTNGGRSVYNSESDYSYGSGEGYCYDQYQGYGYDHYQGDDYYD